MHENLEHKLERSELVERVASLKPQFKDREEAIAFFSQKLEEICASFGKSEGELLAMAEAQLLYDSALMEALSISRKIQILKSIG